MIAYFPTIYPDEWWYSAICRFYVRTGSGNHSLVKEMLFGSEYAAMGSIYPNGTIARVLKRLPEDLYDFHDILHNHTTFRYFTRFYSQEDQRYMEDYLKGGGTLQISHVWKAESRKGWSPKYCPVCAREDEKIYGENYYHTEHQIPFASSCLKHGCKLKSIKIPDRRFTLDDKFYPLSLQVIDDESKDATEQEMRLTRLAVEHLKLPMEYRCSADHNNLYQELLNEGYYKITGNSGMTADYERINTEMNSRYGNELIGRIYGRGVSKNTMNHVRNWDYKNSDRYILLQDLAGISTKEMLGERVIDNSLKDKIEKYASGCGMVTLKSAAKDLGLKEYELRALAEPFWMEGSSGHSKKRKTGRIQISVDEQELAQIREGAKRLGYRCAGDYVLNCVRFCRKDGRITKKCLISLGDKVK